MCYKLQIATASGVIFSYIDFGMVDWKTTASFKTKLVAYRAWHLLIKKFNFDTVGFEAWSGQRCWRIIDTKTGLPPDYDVHQFLKMQNKATKIEGQYCESCGSNEKHWVGVMR